MELAGNLTVELEAAMLGIVQVRNSARERIEPE
jgi:hypothetical protein